MVYIKVVITIDVKNNFFDPSFVAANVGDVLDFEWKEGFHTTTSDTVPSGAATWDAPMNSGETTFMYTITVPGHYHYFCQVHGQMMSGVVEVSGASGIFVPTGSETSIFINSASSHQLSLHYQLSAAQHTSVALYNLAGNKSAQIVDQILPS